MFRRRCNKPTMMFAALVLATAIMFGLVTFTLWKAISYWGVGL